ncbi:hypothetical protein FYM52_04700 [Comamonas sp. CAH-2]|uniref:hypothetical protein n=1 Tax=Comamonas sp. CAH-2 TaxID=2605745 RepID=UPI0012AD4DF9|nr:hypothetical protein [Comamonas sp. CAH-2]MRT19651.1 hypothetical protein [Comamonas sp. CAH-2]
MNLFKSWLIAKLSLLLMLPSAAWSQALPNPQPEQVNRAVSGVLQDSMRTRGFAANDPRFGNTIARISPALTGVAGTTAAAVTVGAVTAPAWATVALAAGIGAVVTFAVSLGLDALVKWLFSDGKIDEHSGALSPANVPGTFFGNDVWCTNQGGGGCAASAEAMAAQTVSNLGQSAVSGSYDASGGVYTLKTNTGLSIYVSKGRGAVSCPGGHYYKGSQCVPLTFPGDSIRTGLSPAEAIKGLPESDLNKQLNPTLLAALANRAWQQAAQQPGYDGLPYPQSNPITSTEAARWAQAHPEYWPTVRDFVRPNPVTMGNPNPWALPSNPTAPELTPSPQPNEGTTNPAKDQPQVNLGPDPAIGAPTLEQIPTAQQIAEPILQLLPELRHFEVQGVTGVCPRPTIDLYGPIVIEAHCKLIEDNKHILQAAMAFAWAAMALFIVLSA